MIMLSEKVTVDIQPDPVFAAYDPDLDEVVMELADWSQWPIGSWTMHLARLATWLRNAIGTVLSGELCRQTGIAPTTRVRIEVDLNPDAPPEAWNLIDRVTAELLPRLEDTAAADQTPYSGTLRIIRGEQIQQQCRPARQLAKAAASGDLERVRSLLATGLNVNTYGYDHGATALGAAIANGQIETTKYLIASGADVNLPTEPHGFTPLATTVEAESDAAQQCNQEPSTAILELLLAAGADPNAFSDPKHAPLRFAQSYRNTKAIELLLRAGAKPLA
jgi:hypothetical protein